MGVRFPEKSTRIKACRTLEELLGLEGALSKKKYQQLANCYQIQWQGRKYDFRNPQSADLPNLAVSIAANFVYSAALAAVIISGAIPALGFIHQNSKYAFALDLADLYRFSLVIPVAFSAIQNNSKIKKEHLFSEIKHIFIVKSYNRQLIKKLINDIKGLLEL